MKITARYVDTCLSDYLQDSYSRPGQTLCLTSPGCSLEDSVEALFDSIDWDAGVPDSTDEVSIKDAFRTALKGVDLRYIDEDGNRQDEESDDEEYNCESYIYVVLEWDATVVKMTMTVDVDYYANGTDPQELKYALENLVRYAAGEGLLLPPPHDSDAIVKDWGATASPKGEEPRKQIDYRHLISSIDGYHGNEMKDRDERSIRREIATLKSIVEGEG
jgi:hypothetical protein